MFHFHRKWTKLATTVCSLWALLAVSILTLHEYKRAKIKDIAQVRLSNIREFLYMFVRVRSAYTIFQEDYI